MNFISHRSILSRSLPYWAGLFLFSSSVLAATSDYQGQITVQFSVDTGNAAGVSATALFEQAQASSEFVTGDGAIAAINPALGPVSAITGFNHSFQASGSANNGTADGLHFGRYEWLFTNTSSASVSVTVGLQYSFAVHATGQSADSRVALELIGPDLASLQFAELTASSAVLDTDSDSGTWSYAFSLPANSSASLYTDATIEGHLQAVPLPSALWLLLSGGLILSRRAVVRQ